MRAYSVFLSLIIFSFGIFNFWQTETESPSALKGFVTLQEMAEETISYEEALTNSKPTVVEFYADWCSTCRAIAPTLFKLHQQYPNVNFVMLNIDKPQASKPMKTYQVTGVPHLVFLSENQTVAETFTGKVPKPILKDVFLSLSRS
ncbi:redoxin domain-containing protein [Euhalothece natronophila Z-M001]|uniref:Redoxin domain-containing protein n=1 Tax=Euhalothece natronophila Z-M001 TaxID=522448 RepID=A0A5B8NK06_9CHRO|nr:thioredoxin domain-containing protein [Euhalothece natronophila]QDZ39653.1 redoxin domain-containing protein [Euhalothece natronophila Z-M001]